MEEKFGLCNTLAFNLKIGTCVHIVFHDMYGLSSNVNSIREHIESKVNKHIDGVVCAYIEGNQTVVITTCYGDITLRIEDFIANKIELVELITANQPDVSEEPEKNLTFTRNEFRDIILKWIDYVRAIHADANDYHINETALHVYVHVYEGYHLIAHLYVETIYDKNNNLVGYCIYNTDAKPSAPFIVINGFTATTELRNLKKLGSSDAKQLFNYVTAGFKFTK